MLKTSQKQYSKREFNINAYIELRDKFNDLFKSFENSIKSNDSGSSEFVEKQLKNFLQYTIVSYDFDLKKINKNIEKTKYTNLQKNKELIEEKNKIQRANAKYVYFLAQILLYAKHIYDLSLLLPKTEIEKNIHILYNIKQYVFNFEESAITGIFFMNQGLNTIDYNNDFTTPNVNKKGKNYLFYDQFVYWYNNELFKKHIKHIFEEFIDVNYIIQNNLKNPNDNEDFNIICNSIIMDIVKKFIDNLNEKIKEPELKRQKIQGGKRIIKKY
jgi:hypothetical protein